jgi:hypothetical protein
MRERGAGRARSCALSTTVAAEMTFEVGRMTFKVGPVKGFAGFEAQG